METQRCEIPTKWRKVTMKLIRSVMIQYDLTCQIKALVTSHCYLKRDLDPVLFEQAFMRQTGKLE